MFEVRNLSLWEGEWFLQGCTANSSQSRGTTIGLYFLCEWGIILLSKGPSSAGASTFFVKRNLTPGHCKSCRKMKLNKQKRFILLEELLKCMPGFIHSVPFPRTFWSALVTAVVSLVRLWFWVSVLLLLGSCSCRFQWHRRTMAYPNHFFFFLVKNILNYFLPGVCLGFTSLKPLFPHLHCDRFGSLFENSLVVTKYYAKLFLGTAEN